MRSTAVLRGSLRRRRLPQREFCSQRAATCWFHLHQHGKTGRQVAMGLAGLVLISDEESKAAAAAESSGDR